MKTQGIRILDNKNEIVSVKLLDILDVISYGELFNWAILYSYVILKPNQGINILELEEKINHSQNGYEINWKNLTQFAEKIHQEIDITIIGCKNKKKMHRYKEDQEMYETCDIVIEMIDSGYWEIFSKDKLIIDKMATKFNDIEFITSDFQK